MGSCWSLGWGIWSEMVSRRIWLRRGRRRGSRTCISGGTVINVGAGGECWARGGGLQLGPR